MTQEDRLLETQETTRKTGKSLASILREQREEYLELNNLGAGTVIVACIPAYNEEKTIAQVILRTRKYVDKVIVCDDGSMDMTAEIAESLGAYVIRHKSNLGKGAALRSALREAVKHDPAYVVVLDGDGQHSPEDIPRLVAPLESGDSDIVIGSRFVYGDHREAPFYRKLGLRVIDGLFSKTVNGDVTDSQSGYRAYTRESLSYLLGARSNGFGVESEQLSIAAQHGLRVKEVEVFIMYKGLENTSKKDPVRHGAEIISSILNLVVTERPISLLGIPGIFSLAVGITGLGFFLYYFNATRYVSIPFALISVGGLVLGSMFILVALVLYAINEAKAIN